MAIVIALAVGAALNESRRRPFRHLSGLAQFHLTFEDIDFLADGEDNLMLASLSKLVAWVILANLIG